MSANHVTEKIQPTKQSHPVFRWPPVLAVTLSTFTVVTAEMMPVGILTPIAEAINVNAGIAGMLLTITGITAAVVATLTPVLAGAFNRRSLLVAFLLILVAGNVLSAVSSDFFTFALARVLIGISMGVIWASAGGIGPRLADPANIGKAMTAIFSGTSIGMVLGLPLGTLIANLAGWRAAFWAIAVVSLVAAIFARVAMPSLPAREKAQLKGLFMPWNDRGVRAGLLITALVVVGHFMAYTYIRPVLEAGSGMTPTVVVILLAVFGLAGILGNFVIGAIAGNNPRRALLIALTAITLGAVLIAFSVNSLILAIIVLALWGAAYGGIGVSTQAWIRIANPQLTERSSALWSGIFNGAIAVGALLGGLVYDGIGGTWLMLIAGAVVVVGLALTFLSRPASRVR